MDYGSMYGRFGMNPMQYQQAPVAGASSALWRGMQQQQSRQVVQVSGMDGARQYAASMPPNSTDAVFDSDRDVFYFLSTDGGGFPTVRPFSFSPMESQQADTQQYVTREELDSALAKIQEMIANGQQPVPVE